MPGMTWRTLTVDTSGDLVNLPSKMFAETDDGIAWFVKNESGVQVKLKIKDFKKKSSGSPISPINFFTNQVVTVEDGETEMIVGQVTFRPSSNNPTVLTKYTIDVSSSIGHFPHDPDLEIDRP